jgi:hypothetical protein
MIAKILLTGKAAAPFNICILFFLFVLITPFAIQKIEYKTWNIIFYAVMPVWFIPVYWLEIKYSIPYSYWVILPISWLFYFWFGIKMKDKEIKLSVPLILCLICAGFMLELVESSVLFSITKKSYFSATALRFSSILYILSIMLLFLKLKNYQPSNQNFLVLLGNNFWGIFLSQMAVFSMVDKAVLMVIPPISTIHYLFYILTVFVFTLLISFLIIVFCKRFIPKKILMWIGFS